MLKLPSPELVRIPLGEGAVAILRPIETPDWLKARAAVREAVAVTDEADPHAGVKFRTALIGALVRGGIQSLEGVADADGSPIEGQPTEEQVDRLLGWYPAYETLEREYAGPILEAEAEKNGFSPSPAGSSSPAGATNTAAAASPGKKGRRAARSVPQG